MKGHEFVQISFHMPASCESCTKPLWAPFRPPPAVECRRCRIKLHKDHTTGLGEGVVPCKVSYDPTTAKEMLLMAPTLEEQQFWVARLLKRIQKSGYKAAGQVYTLSGWGHQDFSPRVYEIPVQTSKPSGKICDASQQSKSDEEMRREDPTPCYSKALRLRLLFRHLY